MHEMLPSSRGGSEVNWSYGEVDDDESSVRTQPTRTRAGVRYQVIRRVSFETTGAKHSKRPPTSAAAKKKAGAERGGESLRLRQ